MFIRASALGFVCRFTFWFTVTSGFFPLGAFWFVVNLWIVHISVRGCRVHIVRVVLLGFVRFRVSWLSDDGEVVEVARADADSEKSLGTNVSGVPLGAMVLFPKEDGLQVPWDDALRLLEVKSVYAVVEEVEPEQVQ